MMDAYKLTFSSMIVFPFIINALHSFVSIATSIVFLGTPSLGEGTSYI